MYIEGDISGMELSRLEYKKIKGFNKKDLEIFISSIYDSGFTDGSKSVSNRMVSAISEGLKNTPGIGEKRYNMVLENILKEARGSNEDDGLRDSTESTS